MQLHNCLIVTLVLWVTVTSCAAELAASDFQDLEALYFHLHRNPELSFKEEHTAARIADELSQLGFEVTRQFGGTGIVAMLRNGEGPTVLIRADMDALPVREQTGLEYVFTTVGTQGIFKGKYNPSNPGKIDWISTAEFDFLPMCQSHHF